MIVVLEKALRGERARIEALIASQEARVRRAFRRFLDTVRSAAVRRQVRLALEGGGIDAVLRVVNAHVVVLGSVVSETFITAAHAEVAALVRQLGGTRAGVALAFDPSYPRAAQIMRSAQLEFVREITAAQQEVTRAALVEALQSGAGPIQVGRAFRDSVGLTEYQRQVVARYRRALETGDAAALARDLRDRRFDSSVRRLLDAGEPLGPTRIGRMVEQYRTRYLQYRAETIARTETQDVVNQARAEALAQVSRQVDLPADAVVRTWRATQDARTRDTHADMDGQERGALEPFVSPRGARLMYPGDSSLGAPGSEIINCRCVVLTTIGVV